MKPFKPALLALLAGLSLPASAAEDVNAGACRYYGQISRSVVDFLLPQTLDNILKMVRGENPEMMAAFTNSMAANMDGTALGAAKSMPPEDIEILGNSAGQQAFQILMSGQASTAAEIQAILENACLSMGVKAIIDGQRQAMQATQLDGVQQQ